MADFILERTQNTIDILEGYQRMILLSKTKEDVIVILKNVYELAKRETYFYLNKDTIKDFDSIIQAIKNCEYAANKFYIIECNPTFSYKDTENQLLKRGASPEEILDYIVGIARKTIVDKRFTLRNPKRTLNEINLKDQCKDTSADILRFSRELGIEAERLRLDYAFDPAGNILDTNEYHYFNIITIQNKKYIVDCTYRQFFFLGDNILDKMGIIKRLGCNPGVYMLQNESRKKTALTILKRGWIEMTPENLKNYLDGFALSYRNGLYYERLGIADYTTTYDIETYSSFLTGKDSQINHEGKEVLGRQLKPLHNPKFKF